MEQDDEVTGPYESGRSRFYVRNDSIGSPNSSSSSSSSMRISYSVNSESEYGFAQRSIAKSGKKLSYVQHMRLKFEKLASDQAFKRSPKFSVGIFPWTSSGSLSPRIPEIPSEDEVEGISDCEEVVPTMRNSDMQDNVAELKVPDILVNGGDEESGEIGTREDSAYQQNVYSSIAKIRLSEPPKRRVIEAKNHHVILKSLSYHPDSDKECNSDYSDDETQAKSNTFDARLFQYKQPVPPPQQDIPLVIEELLQTEESYVKNLKIGIENYGSLFESRTLDRGLRGMKWTVLGNIEQIVDFHENEFLPMVKENCNDLKKLFDNFSKFIDENCFYAYVMYTMNKKKSLRVCNEYKEYFKEVQEEIGDKLGINSFLMQPIQRLTKYPLLLQQFMTTCFKSGDIKYKPAIESCCRVEKKLRNILITANESEEVNDIEECYDINIQYQGRFKKVNEFLVYDYTQRREYKSKAFMFDKCFIYAEIKDDRLIYRGCYPSEHIGIVTKPKSFTLYYQKRKIQECEFNAKQNIIDIWIEYIQEMMGTFIEEEKRKLKEKYSKMNDIYRRPESVIIYRNPSRLSSDSGIGSVLNASTPASESVSTASPRTTWYTENLLNS